MVDLSYDDSNLQQLFAALEPKQRLKALRRAFRREAGTVRKVAVNNLRRCIRSGQDLEKGVRALLFKRKAGFRVTVGTKRTKKGKEYGYHTNRKDLKKPILIWAEKGTNRRYTKTATKVYNRSRRGHYTGRMRRYGFMQQTQDDVRNTVTENLRREIIKCITDEAKKYGCY